MGSDMHLKRNSNIPLEKKGVTGPFARTKRSKTLRVGKGSEDCSER